MALAASSLVSSGSTTDGSSFTTGSITPTAYALVLAFISFSRDDSTEPVLPTTVSGNGLTWTLITNSDQYFKSSGGTSREKCALYRGMAAAPTAGGVTFNFGVQTITSITWQVSQITAVDTTGTNGSGAIVQTTTNTESGNAPSITTLAAFGNSGNRPFVGMTQNNATDSYAVEASWTLLAHTSIGTPGIASAVGFRSDTTDTTTDWTANTGSGAQIAIEVKLALTQSVTGALITNSPTLYQFAATQQVVGALISNSYTIFAPTPLAPQSVTGALITNSPTVSAPVVTQSVAGALVTNSPTLYDFALTQQTVGSLITNTATLFQFSANQQIVVGLITITPSVFTPTQVEVSVAESFIDNTGVLFAFTVPQGVILGLITQTGITVTPQVNLSVALPLLDRTGVTFDLRPTYLVQPGFISITPSVFAPVTIFQLLQMVFLDASATLYTPMLSLTAGDRQQWARVDQLAVYGMTSRGLRGRRIP